MNKYKNIVRVGDKFYDLDDPCTNCSHSFECTEEGKTKAGAYPQMSTSSKRYCLHCGSVEDWVLKKGKQPWLHKVEQEV